MILKAIGIWLILLVVAIANGALRVAALNAWLGEARANQASCLTGSAAILMVSILLIPRLGVTRTRRLLGIGALWLALTVTFEFLFGHYVTHASWERLLEDYNIMAGRLWLLMLATTLMAPLIAGKWRREHTAMMKSSTRWH